MNHDSPFGIKRTSPQGSDENSLRFAKLKPICVELLGSITKGKGALDAEAVFRLLKRLHGTLSPFIDARPERTPLSPSLINYIFFPLARLLRASTKDEAELPDRIRQVVFQVLSSLASDWWQTWTDCLSPSSAESRLKIQEQWKVWEQLLILGAVALGGPPDSTKTPRKPSSEETKLAVCSFLQELLIPRLAIASIATTKATKEWEWDGEEELPSLDDYDEYESMESTSITTSSNQDDEQAYPSIAHLQHVFSNKTSRGAMAHALTASLDLAASNNVSASVKVDCLKLSRIIVRSWLADDFPHREDISSLYKEVTLTKIFGGRRKSDQDDSKVLSQADRVVVYLPGYVSSMIRILGSASTQNSSQVISQALLSLAVILKVCLADGACSDLPLTHCTQKGTQAGQADSLDDLVAQMQVQDELTDKSATLLEEKVALPATNGDSTKETNRNGDWLENTIAHVVIALFSIDPLAKQSHSHVQLGLIHLADVLLYQCSQVLSLQHNALLGSITRGDESSDLTRLLMRWIVDTVASDTTVESVRTLANESIYRLFSSHSKLYRDAAVDEILSIVQAIPALLASQDDDDVERKTNRLRFLLSLSTSDFDSSITIFDGVKVLLQPSDGLDKWGRSLLWSIKIDERASVEGNSTHITLQGLSSVASRAVIRAFGEIGRALCRLVRQDCATEVGNDKSFALLWSFMDQACTNRSSLLTASSRERHSRTLSQNALLIVDLLMCGIAELMDDAILGLQTSREGKKMRRVAHRLAKEMMCRVSDLWTEDEEELLQQDVSIQRDAQSSAERSLYAREYGETNVIKRRRGISEDNNALFERPTTFGPALKLDFVTPATLPISGSLQGKNKSALQIQSEAKEQLERSDALLLSILRSSARILGPKLKPLLLKMLYPITCGVASQSFIIREAAMQSMDEMARSAGYASIQGCILDHADYVLGTASHRLVSTLGQELQAIAMREKGDEVVHFPLVSAQSAPLVLVEIIRMLGGEALTLVQDAIDEVLDTIDRHHLQEDLCDDLLNVLSRLIEVMLEDERKRESHNGNVKHNTVNAATIAFRPNVDRDMEDLQRWWHKRQAKVEAIESAEELRDDKPDEEAQVPDESDTSNSSQAVVVSMLEKAIPFLSHSSAMIRTRCLRLLSWGIELLCLQGRTVEPLQVVNKAWPAFMSRLGFSLSLSLSPYEKGKLPAYEDLSERDFIACTEAAKFVTILAKYLVDYLGPKKMLQQAVPRLLLLLRMVEKPEGKVKQSSKEGNQRTFLLKDEPTSSTSLAPPLQTFKPLQRYSPLYTMTESVISILDTLVKAMGPRIPEADLFQYAVHPILVSCLDKRQDEHMQKLAHHFYFTTLNERNENLVWFILSAAHDKDNQFPTFLHRQDLDLQW